MFEYPEFDFYIYYLTGYPDTRYKKMAGYPVINLPDTGYKKMAGYPVQPYHK